LGEIGFLEARRFGGEVALELAAFRDAMDLRAPRRRRRECRLQTCSPWLTARWTLAAVAAEQLDLIRKLTLQA